MGKQDPFVLCLTNTVAANFTANVLLAIGAKPAMIEEPAEAAELAGLADATLVNVGTLHARQAEAMRAAVAAAERAGKPWVLDPVAVHLLDYRRRFVVELLREHSPAMIRGNQAEVEFLRHLVAGPEGGELSGDGAVVSGDGAVWLATGETDAVYPAEQARRFASVTPELICGGVPRLQTVTATGCAQGAVCAAMLGRGLSPLEAACSASKLMKRAGELAYARAQAPGSFQIALLDALWELGCPQSSTSLSDFHD